jgi:hypothetical protein
MGSVNLGERDCRVFVITRIGFKCYGGRVFITMLGLLHFYDVTIKVSYVLEQRSVSLLHSPGSCRKSILGYILRVSDKSGSCNCL